MDVARIFSEFKKEGKQLNRRLSKAAHMKNVFSDDDITHIKKLNKILTDLMGIMKTTRDEAYAQTIKRMIQAFTSEAIAVNKCCEPNQS